MGKNVTIICNSFPPEKGGAPTRIYNLACLLRDNGYLVTVVAAMPNYPTGKIFPAYKGKVFHSGTVDGITVKRTWIIPANSKNIFYRGLGIVSHISSLSLFISSHFSRHRPDVVIISSPPLLQAAASVFIAKRHGIKTVLNISDIWPLSAAELGAVKPGPMLRFLQRIEHRIYKKADAFMGQSQEILRHIANCYPEQKPVFLYRNLQTSPQVLPLQAQQSTPKIIYAGILGIAQGVLEICQQVDFHSTGTELHIYGDGLERTAIAQYIHLHPERGIYLHETVPSEAMPGILSRHQAVLIPLKTTIAGAVPSKLFMAFANQLPVLFSAGGEGATIVSQTSSGWVNAPGDYEALKKNLSAFAALTPEVYLALKQNVARASEKDFNKEFQDRQFLTFFQSLLS